MDKKIFTTLNEYKKSYNVNLENHLKEYIDYDELHFIKFQLTLYKSAYHSADVKYHKIELGSDRRFPNNTYKFSHDILKPAISLHVEVWNMIKDYNSPRTNYFNLELCEKLSHSFSKIIAYLNQLQNELLNENMLKNNQLQISKLSWEGSILEFTEVIKSLILTKKISTELNQKEIFRRLRDCFNIDDFNENDKLRDIRNRTNTTTPFINKLEISLNNWIKAKD